LNVTVLVAIYSCVRLLLYDHVILVCHLNKTGQFCDQTSWMAGLQIQMASRGSVVGQNAVTKVYVTV